MDISRDPISNAIYGPHGIKQGIKVALDNECYASALILIYSGIDAMANLGRPKNQKEVEPEDFIRWANTYIKIDAQEQITGEEFYSARCAVLHTYGVESRKTRSGTARKLLYMVGGHPPVPVLYQPNVDKDSLLLDISALADAFFRGLDQFLIDAFADTQKRQILEERLQWLLNAIPLA